jgi:hypothetical protein
VSIPKSTARLFVAYSENPKRTLVLRRGPSRQVATFNWDRTTDKFTLGQWLKGKIYWHRADISPDGKHWIYLALGRGGQTYTVVAKTPFLKALDYHPWMGTWGGGGRFVSNKGYELAGHSSILNRKLSGQFQVSERNTTASLGILNRLQRQGWSYMMNGDYTRKIGKGWILHKHVGEGQKFGRSNDSEWHSLSHKGLDLKFKRPNWEWADLDGKNLVFAEGGKLFKASLNIDPEQPFKSTLIHDFNDYTFKPLRAPY